MKSTYTTAYFLALLLSILAFSPKACATHTMGADITYSCIGPGQYQVVLTMFRDCGGILPQDTQIIEVRNVSWIT